MWHASVSGRAFGPVELQLYARQALESVGDPSKEWHEWTGQAYHVRRRLTAEEEATIGPAVDCRGTAEWATRYYAIAHKLPEVAKRLAQQEMLSVQPEAPR